MAPTKASTEHIISLLYSRNWGPPDGGPGWHNHLGPGAIAAIVLGIFFFLMLLGCICLTYSSRFTGRRRSRSRSTRSYYTNTSYAATAAQRGGDGSSLGDGSHHYYPGQYTMYSADNSGTRTGRSSRAKSKRQKRHKTSSVRPKSRMTVSSVASPSSGSSVPPGETVPEAVWSPTPSMAVASDTATIAGSHDTVPQAEFPRTIKRAKTRTRKYRR